MFTKRILHKTLLLLAAGACITSCTKPVLDDDFPAGDPPPIGAYTNSDEVAASELVAHFPFEGNPNDVKGGVTGGTLTGSASFVAAGRKGQAYQGANNSFIAYNTAGPLASLASYTVSMWINTQKHDGGAQSVFTVPKGDGSFWGNFFMLIEGAGASENRMLVKVHMEKNSTPPVPNVEHWLETNGDLRLNDMYGGWRHIAFTYNAATSTFTMYANGNLVPFPEATTKREAATGQPLGALAFKDANRFIIGGFQNHLGAPFNGLEPWMLTYTGRLDEFRVYKSALSAQDLNAVFQLEKQGR